ncbi:MAG: acyl-CoA thioester hydrolase [Candidatus Azotimanducaceae bacterium]|jgi:acyl-CoA thioester hydrolase
MELTFRSSVNQWECDENAHLNVRFYVAKHVQTLLNGLLAEGRVASAETLNHQVSVQHLRFLKESRLATPLSGYFALIAISGRHVTALTELRHSANQDVLCTCIHQMVLDPPQNSELAGAAPSDFSATLPDYCAPRGVVDEDTTYAGLARSQVDEFGFRLIGRGVISADEVTASGDLQTAGHMGRISDSMPHLWTLLGAGEQDENGNEGGAVLEYRLAYHQKLRLDHRFSIYSGLSEASAKVQKFVHLVFDDSTGKLSCSAVAAAVRMDLKTRKALKIDSERIQTMREHQLKHLNLP